MFPFVYLGTTQNCQRTRFLLRDGNKGLEFHVWRIIYKDKDNGILWLLTFQLIHFYIYVGALSLGQLGELFSGQAA